MTIPTPIIDSHCHYNLDPFYSNWQKYWLEAQAAGVIAAVVVGTDAETSCRACEIAALNAHILAAVGIHPTEAGTLEQVVTKEHMLTMVKTWQKSGPIAAIGETGLDYFRLNGTDAEVQTNKEKQLASFSAHLAAAAELQLPVIVHVRDKAETAYHDVITALAPYAPKVKIILHCFSGPDWYLSQALTMGCFISFAGNITYPNAQNLRAHVRNVPPNRLLVETDAPFLPPQQHRGQQNEPKFIAETVQYLHEELHLDPVQLVNNAREIFTTLPSDV